MTKEGGGWRSWNARKSNPLRPAVPRGWKRSWRAREGCARSVKGSRPRCNKYAIQESCAASIRQLFGCAASQEQCLLSDEATTGLWKTRNREGGRNVFIMRERPRLSRHLYIGVGGGGDFFSHLSAETGEELRRWIFTPSDSISSSPLGCRLGCNNLTRCRITRMLISIISNSWVKFIRICNNCDSNFIELGN